MSAAERGKAALFAAAGFDAPEATLAPTPAAPGCSPQELVRLSGGKVRPSTAEAMDEATRATLGGYYRVRGQNEAHAARMNARLDAVVRGLRGSPAPVEDALASTSPTGTTQAQGASRAPWTDEELGRVEERMRAVYKTEERWLEALATRTDALMRHYPGRSRSWVEQWCAEAELYREAAAEIGLA